MEMTMRYMRVTWKIGNLVVLTDVTISVQQI